MHDAIDWADLTRGQAVIVHGTPTPFQAVIVEIRWESDEALTTALVANAEGLCSRHFTSNLAVEA